MSDRKRGVAVHDDDGTSLIDSGALLLALRDYGVRDSRDLRRWAMRHGLRPARRGAHGAGLWRWDDVLTVLDKIAAVRQPAV